MSKNYAVDTVTTIRTGIFVMEDALDADTGLYHIGKLRITITATGSGANASPYSDTFLGAGQASPYTAQETYTAINNYNSLNTMLATKLKEVYLDAISVDISV